MSQLGGADVFLTCPRLPSPDSCGTPRAASTQRDLDSHFIVPVDIVVELVDEIIDAHALPASIVEELVLEPSEESFVCAGNVMC